VAGAEGKKYMWWFDAPMDTFQPQRMGFTRRKRLGTYWKIKTQSWFTWKNNIVFSLCDFPAMLKAEGSYILPENVPANEFLNLGEINYRRLKTGQFGCTNI
jgi:methionyl-tRNA synthetase